MWTLTTETYLAKGKIPETGLRLCSAFNEEAAPLRFFAFRDGIS